MADFNFPKREKGQSIENWLDVCAELVDREILRLEVEKTIVEDCLIYASNFQNSPTPKKED